MTDQPGEKSDQRVARDDRGQDQAADKQRAQQSQMEGPAAYAPLGDDDEKAAPIRGPATKKTGES